MSSELQTEAYGPHGDASRHLSTEHLRAALDGLPAPDSDCGKVVLVCARQADGTRDMPERARLSRANGLEGDGWARRPPRELAAQLAVINHAIVGVLANGQAVTLSGDNLYVDFDLCATNLPTGTRLAVGDAIVEVSPKPHNGCAKFAERFGADALRVVQAPATRAQNLRGIYWKVHEDGDVWPGAPIRVLQRGAKPD